MAKGCKINRGYGRKIYKNQRLEILLYLCSIQEASEAYEVLSDEQKRAEYDSFGSQQSASSGFNQQNPFSQQGRQGNFRWEYKVTTSSIFTKSE